MAGDNITIDQAVDLGYSTLQQFDKDDVTMTLVHSNYEPINIWFQNDKKVVTGGDEIQFDVSLRDTGNAKHTSLYGEDTRNVNNVTAKGKVEWKKATTNFSYTLEELSINQGNPQRIYDLIKNRRDNMIREFVDLLYEAAFTVPTDADDAVNPYGIPGWLTLGTDGSTGDWTGYVGNYQDGVDYNVGNITCSSSQNSRWASYYADHDGELGDNLLSLLRRAMRKTKFKAPLLAQKVGKDMSFTNFRMYTNDNVMDNLESLADAKDDNVGYDLGKYHGTVVFKGIPFEYVDILDTADTNVYGTDPVFGVNHDCFKPYILNGFDFEISKPMNNKENQHNVLSVYMDLIYGYVCKDRRMGGFLVSQQ